MNYIIKKLASTDLLLAKRFFKWLQTDDKVLNPTIPPDEYLDNLLSQNTFHVIVAVEENDLVIGGLTAYELPMYIKEETEMFLYEIGVDENYRQKGIAGKLIGDLKKICLNKGIKIIFVGTSMDNEPAKKLYKATGGVMEEIPWFTYNLDDEKITG